MKVSLEESNWSASRTWMLIAFAAFALSLLRGIHLPGAWTYAHYLFNYEQGFIKRGLVGAVVSQLPPIAADYRVFTVLSLTLLLANIVLLSLAVRDMIRSRQPWLLFGALVFVTSLATTMLANTVGYFDHIGLFITLVALRIKSFRLRFAYLALVLPIALLIHEALLILFFPTLLIALVTAIKSSHQGVQYGAVSVLSALLLLGAVLLSEQTLDAQAAERLLASRRAVATAPISEDAFEVLRRNAQENHRIMGMLWRNPRRTPLMALSLFVTAPSFALLCFVMYQILKASRKPWWYRLACMLAASSPLVLHLLGLDIHRWNTLWITTGFLVLYALVQQLDLKQIPFTQRPLLFVLP